MGPLAALGQRMGAMCLTHAACSRPAACSSPLPPVRRGRLDARVDGALWTPAPALFIQHTAALSTGAASAGSARRRGGPSASALCGRTGAPSRHIDFTLRRRLCTMGASRPLEPGAAVRADDAPEATHGRRRRRKLFDDGGDEDDCDGDVDLEQAPAAVNVHIGSAHGRQAARWPVASAAQLRRAEASTAHVAYYRDHEAPTLTDMKAFLDRHSDGVSNLFAVYLGWTQLNNLPCPRCQRSHGAHAHCQWAGVACTHCGLGWLPWHHFEQYITSGRCDRDAPMSLGNAALDLWQRSLGLADFAKECPESFQELRQRLGMSVIHMDTFNAYKVRGIEEWGDYAALMYPRFRRTMYQENERPSGGLEPTGLKMIRLKNQRLEKEIMPPQSEDEPGQRSYFPGIFGWHLVTPTDRTIVLTTNEKDAMCIYDATGEVALALPNADRVDYQVLPYLEEFDYVYLWFPSASLEAAKEFAHVISPLRTFIVTHPERPLELLQSGRKGRIMEILRTNTITRRALNQSHFRTSAEHRMAVRDSILNYNTATRGIAQFTRWPLLNKIFGGFRGGELSIMTGPTGVGKTTFLCEYVVDLAKQGVRTLFCSFEMPESRVLQWMACQFAQQPLWRTTRSSELDRILDRFERMEGGPITLNSAAFSGVPVNKVAESIRDQVLLSRIQHVVIDNLQFLVGSQNSEPLAGYTKFDLQDAFVGLMRRMATEHQCHVTIVAHPKKTEGEITLHTIYGGARLTQEADNVMVIDRVIKRAPRREAKVFKVLKNRYNGNRLEEDAVELHFNQQTLCHRMEAPRWLLAGAEPLAPGGGGGGGGAGPHAASLADDQMLEQDAMPMPPPRRPVRDRWR